MKICDVVFCDAGGGGELFEVSAETRGAPAASCRLWRILHLQSEQLDRLQNRQCSHTLTMLKLWSHHSHVKLSNRRRASSDPKVLGSTV